MHQIQKNLFLAQILAPLFLAGNITRSMDPESETNWLQFFEFTRVVENPLATSEPEIPCCITIKEMQNAVTTHVGFDFCIIFILPSSHPHILLMVGGYMFLCTLQLPRNSSEILTKARK